MIKLFGIIISFFCLKATFAQSILNGSFEINTAGTDQLNLQNAQYNSFISNSTAFGDWNGGGPAGGNIDIIGSSDYCGQAQCGNWFVALTSGGTDAISLKLSSPLIAGNTYSISFYDRSCTPFPPGEGVEVGVSNFNNLFGILVYAAPPPVYDAGWTHRMFSFIAPDSAWYVTVRCGGVNHQLPWTQVDNFTVTSTCSDNLDLGNDTALCAGNSLLLNAGTSCATYLWLDGSTVPTLTVTQTGAYWVEVSQDACVFRDTISVAFVSPKSLDLGDDTTLCSGETLWLRVSIPGAAYQWRDGSTNDSFAVTQPGMYWVNVTLGGCVTADTINVTFYPATEISLGNDTTLCEGESLLLNAGTTGADYLWQDGSVNSIFAVSEAGTYWVRVALNSCESSDTINVMYVLPPSINLGRDTVLCAGGVLSLNAATPGAAYQWQDGSTDSEYSATQSGEYWVNVMLDGCISGDTVNAAFSPAPEINVGNDTTLCEGESLLLNAGTTGGDYVWQDGSTNSTFNVTQQGIFWVEAVLNNCSDRDSIIVNYLDKLILNLGNDTAICAGAQLALNTGINSAAFRWQDGSSESQLTVANEGIYYVAATTECETLYDSITIRLMDCGCELFLPKAFTPNNDGINDVFRPRSDCSISGLEIKIFNRWGETVFRGSQENSAWNGKFKGRNCPAEVYAYIAWYNTESRRRIMKSGNVSLIR